MRSIIITILLAALCRLHARTQPANQELAVIAYYSGNSSSIDQYDIGKLTHLIYSFVHLRGQQLYVSPAAGKIINKLVALKQQYPGLKVQVAFGGWGGCKTCSAVFADSSGRKTFAHSVTTILDRYKLDGIDLDWEYPAVQGPEGHAFKPSDKAHFTELLKTLRDSLGNEKEISFAAGAFPDFLEQSIEWKKAAPYVDRIHLMTYDLVNRLSPATGHHAGLYSTSKQKKSADNAVNYLLQQAVPAHKIVIGAAFYSRVYEDVRNINNGLYQPGKFKKFVVYKSYRNTFSEANGYETFWDDEAGAPFSYNASKRIFATYDNEMSVRLKTAYAIKKGLGGIMFWELRQDIKTGGLLDAIYNTKAASGHR